MKKQTKACLIIFIVTLIVGFVMTMFIPDEMLQHLTTNGSLLGAFSLANAMTNIIRCIISVAIAVTVTLLIRIVDTDEKKEAKKSVKKVTTKKEA